jgi:hypothetical protein
MTGTKKENRMMNPVENTKTVVLVRIAIGVS